MNGAIGFAWEIRVTQRGANSGWEAGSALPVVRDLRCALPTTPFTSADKQAKEQAALRIINLTLWTRT
jgi:hypothetical protein